MRLVRPTDFKILNGLSDGKRDNATNLAFRLDEKRDYINTRLPMLADYGLIEKVGPSPNSGLYVITDRGEIALSHRDQYSEVSDFEELIEKELES